MNQRSCPLCNKSISASKFGTHLLSSQHCEELATYRPGNSLCPGTSSEAYLSLCRDKIKDKRLIHFFAGPGMTKKHFGCFGCLTVREKDDLEHFKKHPECAERHAKRGEEFLCRAVQTVAEKSADTELRLRRQAEKQKQQLEQLMEEIEEWKAAIASHFGKEMELEEFKAFIKEKQESPLPVIKEEIAINEVVETSLPGKDLYSVPKGVEVEESPSLPTRNEVAPFPGREVSRPPVSIIQRKKLGPKLIPKRVSFPLIPPIEQPAAPAAAGGGPWDHLSYDEMVALMPTFSETATEQSMEQFAEALIRKQSQTLSSIPGSG